MLNIASALKLLLDTVKDHVERSHQTNFYLKQQNAPTRTVLRFDTDRKEQGEYSGNVVGLDLGLKFFTKDQNDNAVIYPQFLRKAEKQLKKTQRRLSKKFVKGAKPQSNNYHKARKRLVQHGESN